MERESERESDRESDREEVGERGREILRGGGVWVECIVS